MERSELQVDERSFWFLFLFSFCLVLCFGVSFVFWFAVEHFEKIAMYLKSPVKTDSAARCES